MPSGHSKRKPRVRRKRNEPSKQVIGRVPQGVRFYFASDQPCERVFYGSIFCQYPGYLHG